ncbi:MAG: hypothetical protein DI528_08190 [Shinella sp.]|nr:MAG: hypothetical protein DI528_08190 [Shinella sp.]
MPRPRKYASEADAKAAKLDKQHHRRAAKHALKKDPTKRKDAAVNAEALPLAPVNDETMAAIREILNEAGELQCWGGGMMASFTTTRKCAAMMADWEEAHKLRLPVLDQTGEPVVWSFMTEGINGPVTLSYPMTFGERWNRFCGQMRFLLHWDKRGNANRRKNELRAERERVEANAAGLTVTELRTSKDVNAKRKWQEQTQAAYHRAKSEKALAKRNARIEREGIERMREQETFGRF